MNWGVYFGVTICIAGWAAYMMGQALASTWRPMWQVILYSILLGLADRFIVFALFDGELLSISGWLIDTATLMLIGLLSYRSTQARKMVSQYPWLYRRSGPFSWRQSDTP